MSFIARHYIPACVICACSMVAHATLVDEHFVMTYYSGGPLPIEFPQVITGEFIYDDATLQATLLNTSLSSSVLSVGAGSIVTWVRPVGTAPGGVTWTGGPLFLTGASSFLDILGFPPPGVGETISGYYAGFGSGGLYSGNPYSANYIATITGSVLISPQPHEFDVPFPSWSTLLLAGLLLLGSMQSRVPNR